MLIKVRVIILTNFKINDGSNKIAKRSRPQNADATGETNYINNIYEEPKPTLIDLIIIKTQKLKRSVGKFVC